MAIGLAACFAAFTWSASRAVFLYPEKEENYEILRKLNRLPHSPHYKPSEAPRGVSLGPIALYSQFLSIDSDARTQLNTLLKRQLTSGFETQDLIYYVEGDYQILEIRDLTEDDLVTEGLLIKAQASIRPDEARSASLFPLILEYILPNAKSNQKILYSKGDTISLKKVPSYCAVIHTHEHVMNDDSIAVITAIPIVKGLQSTPDKQKISVSLTETYNVSAELPMLDY